MATPPPSSPVAAPRDPVIVRAAVHPAIGIARLGNSEEFFVGPEVVNPAPQPPGFYRDASGALKRQAARFRLYGLNAAGDIVRELTPADSDIRWRVHVANRKASWYQWIQAMDIPESATVQAPLRNAKVTGTDRQALDIDPGERTIEGTETSGTAYRFDGAFQGTPVYLGELRTDERGRLLFLGGLGTSASPTGEPIYDPELENAFINAEGWYDDASDGPVTATVTIQGRDIPVDGAWVVTAPPNYAPDLVAIRTLYDLLVDLYVENHWMPAPERPSFTQDVYPILQRMSGLQWVNRGFATQFGAGGPTGFENPDLVLRLAQDPSTGGYDTWGELRRQVFNEFRLPVPTDANPTPWPWEYGDADAIPGFPNAPGQNLALTATQHATLQQWAAGEFVADWPADGQPVRDVNALPVDEQPAMLDRAALHFCLADAFHPGCEVTWPIRHLSLYTAPFRIRVRPAGVPEPDYGPTLSQAQALAADGPLWAQGPGDLTRWMGLPWQEDTAYCRAGYDPGYDPYLPTFWPARVPNQVLSEADYRVVMDASRPRAEREAAFSRRAEWTRLLGTPHTPAEVQMMNMVHRFGDMGVVEMREGVPNDPLFPPVMMVENAILPAPAEDVLFKAGAPAAGALEAAAAPEPPPPAGRNPRERFRSRADYVAAHVSPQAALRRSAPAGTGEDGPGADGAR